jgi:hypothetical protein
MSRQGLIRILRSVLPFSRVLELIPFLYRHEETPMRKSLFSIATAAMLVSGVGLASAQTTTTTTTQWTAADGTAMTQYSTTQKYQSFSDPALVPTVGMVLPGTVTVYPLPTTVVAPASGTYSYSIINNQPVVVDTTTRKVVHTW